MKDGLLIKQKKFKLLAWLRSSFSSSGGAEKKLALQRYLGDQQLSVIDMTAKVEVIINAQNHIEKYLEHCSKHDEIIPKVKGILNPGQLKDKLIESNIVLKEIKQQYRNNKTTVERLDEYRKSFDSTEKELREHIEKESFDKANDLKHKLYLTVLRTVQIPIFIMATYSSIQFAVWVMDERDLVIPRGLISIVPSSLEKSAKNLATTEKPSTPIITNEKTANSGL